MKDRLEDRLRRLNIGSPDPELREKVILAVEAALPETNERRGWLAEWRVESMLAVGIAVAAVLLLMLNGSGEPFMPPMVHIDQAAVETLVEELDLNPEMESRYRERLAWTRERLASTRRFGNEERIIEWDAN